MRTIYKKLINIQYAPSSDLPEGVHNFSELWYQLRDQFYWHIVWETELHLQEDLNE